MIWRRRGLGSEEGAELVEFALVLPFLLFVVLGIAEFGILLQRYEVLVNAAREGARVAVLPGYSAADVTARVTQYIDSGRVPYTSTNPTIATTSPDLTIVNGASTTTIPMKRVTVTYTYTFMFLPKFARWGNPNGYPFTTLTLTTVAEMRAEAGS
jgi:Flp pilus assembly protein TadG